MQIKKKKIDSIKDILPNVIKELSTDKIQEQRDIQSIWKNLIGNLAEYTEVVGQREDKLLIRVSDSTRLYDLNIKKRSLVKKIQKDFPTVKEIVLKIGKIA